MEIYCEIKQGLRPDLLDRVAGLRVDEDVQTIGLCIVDFDSPELLRKEQIARVFGLFINQLIRPRPIYLLFPYNEGEVKRVFRKANVNYIKHNNQLTAEIPSSEPQLLIDTLSIVGFTAFYGLVNGIKSIQNKPGFLFSRLEEIYLLIVFSLYDDSIELLSKTVPLEKIVGLLQNVGTDLSIGVNIKS